MSWSRIWHLSLAATVVAFASCTDDVGPVAGSAAVSSASGTGGASSATSSTSGSGAGGAGASTGAGGAGGEPQSAGCGMADPPSGALSIDVGGESGAYIVSLPTDYDPAEAYPLGFAFHGFGRTGPQCQAGDCAGFQTVMEDSAVLVYMTSMGGAGWDDFDLNATFFDTVLNHMLDAYCIDPTMVFAAGTSSGAHFSNVVGCRFGDRLAAIAPVAGYLPMSSGCVGGVAALVIHGVLDSSFSSGEVARDFWREQSGCSDVTVPTIADVHAGALATAESHGCAVYQGCDAGVGVTWCEHSEGGYDGSTHGWPLFGGQQIWDFVNAL